MGAEEMDATYDYVRDGTAIYERSFAFIRAEADLKRFSPKRPMWPCA